VRPHRPATALLVCLAAHCGGAAPGAMRERIGGALRQRSFASPTAYESYLRGELALARGDAAAAAAQLELALLADGADGFLAARRVEVLLAQGERAEALRAAELAARQHPADAAVLLSLAEARRAGGDDAGAEDAIVRAAALEPDDPDVRAALSAQHGGSSAEVARARRDAPQATDGDRTLARRALLDPGGDDRRATLTRRRLDAAALRAQGQWSAVDRVLTPAVLRDATNHNDRALLIEARARDGRPRDAAALVRALPDAPAYPTARRALAWLLAGEFSRADADAAVALASRPDDHLTMRVRAQALAALGDVPGALALLARVPVDAPWSWAGEFSRDAWGAAGRDLIDAAGRDVSDRGRAFASARITAASLLARGGHRELADETLARALAALDGAADAAASRDALRLARARLTPARPDALRDVETAWGRHRRALETPAPQCFDDLRAASGDAREDAEAQAWRVVRAREHGAAGADEGELRAALAVAERDAPASPITRRARAALGAP